MFTPTLTLTLAAVVVVVAFVRVIAARTQSAVEAHYLALSDEHDRATGVTP